MLRIHLPQLWFNLEHVQYCDSMFSCNSRSLRRYRGNGAGEYRWKLSFPVTEKGNHEIRLCRDY